MQYLLHGTPVSKTDFTFVYKLKEGHVIFSVADNVKSDNPFFLKLNFESGSMLK